MSFEFDLLLLEISKQLTSENLEGMKFLCREKIGKKDMEKIKDGLTLFGFLKERGQLSVDNTDFLSKLLTTSHRQDLCEKLQSFQGTVDEALDPTERDKLDTATGLISEQLGKYWRKLGRKLGFTEVKLESISKRHPTDLEETVVELLKEWRKSRGAEARVEELLQALRACQYNMTADKIEDQLAERR